MIVNQLNTPGSVRGLLINPNWGDGDLPAGFVGADIVQSPSEFACVAASRKEIATRSQKGK